MSIFVKLVDLQKLDATKLTGEIFRQIPLTTNYLIENKISCKEVAKVYQYFNKSSITLGDHIQIPNPPLDCYLELPITTYQQIVKSQS